MTHARGITASYFDGYPPPVANVLGLLGIAAFIAFIIGLAMCVTWTVVKISPTPGRKKQKPKPRPAEPAA